VDRTVQGARQKIENLLEKTKGPIFNDEPELQAQLARYLCVLLSGHIEQSLISLMREHARNKSAPTIFGYAEYNLSRLQNAKFEDILQLLGRFNPSWRDRFENGVSEEIKDAVDSVVNNRNQIAHGMDVGISIVTFERFYKCVRTLLTELETFVSNE
jgi:hypothetical protein